MDFSKVPFSIEEIKFSQERAFRANEQLFVKNRSNENGDIFADLIDAISDMTEIPTAELNALPIALDGDEELSFYTLQNGQEVSLVRLYRHITTVIDSYTPDESIANLSEFWVDYKGEPFGLSVMDVKKSFGLVKSITAGEAIEVMEIQSRFRLMEKAYSDEISYTDESGEEQVVDGAMLMVSDYKFGLQEAAILLKRHGDVIPASRSKLKEWISKRADYLKDIGLKEMLDLRFFLTSILVGYRLRELRSIYGLGGQKQSTGRKAPIFFRTPK